MAYLIHQSCSLRFSENSFLAVEFIDDAVLLKVVVDERLVVVRREETDHSTGHHVANVGLSNIVNFGLKSIEPTLATFTHG